MARLTVLLFTLTLSVASSTPGNDIVVENVTPLSAEPDEVTLPLNFVNFHPINRHFHRRPLTTTTASYNRRPCHHHRRHELWGRDGMQISYGNDMIFSGEEEKATGTDHGVVTDIPTIKILVGPFPSEEDDGSKKIMVKLVKRKEEGEGEREYYKGLFKRKIRKFLNHLV